MTGSSLLQQFVKKELTAGKIAKSAIQHPELLREIFEGLNAKKADIKYGCLKIFRLISERQPAILYPHLDF